MHSQTGEVLLEVRNLKKYFPILGGTLKKVTGYVRAVDDVSFSIKKGETLGLVGESGCGKTTVGRCLVRLTDPTAGEIFFDMPPQVKEVIELEGKLTCGNDPAQKARHGDIKEKYDLAKKKGEKLREVRRHIQMVFQDPAASLNPRMLVKDLVGEPLLRYGLARGESLRKQVSDLLRKVGLGEEHLFRFPHEFSGGQRQRISIARALVLKPKFLILDEPTSALDVSVQAQILNLLKELQRNLGLTYLLISHDIGVVKHMANRIVVMYAGKLAEVADADEIFRRPLHPYTNALLSSTPIADPFFQREKIYLEGEVPDPSNPPQGCRFHTRCNKAMKVCGWEGRDLLQMITAQAERTGWAEPYSSIISMRPDGTTLQLTLRAKEGEGSDATFLTDMIGKGRQEGDPLFESICEIKDLDEGKKAGRKVIVRFTESEGPRMRDLGREHWVSCYLHS